MTSRQPGPDHSLYAHAPLPERVPLRWPNNAQLACCVFLYLEHWELDPPPEALYDRRMDNVLGGLHPNYKVYCQFEYGNRVGIFRILDALARHAIPVTVAANGGACAKYPFLVQHLMQRGYAFAAHGTFATQMLSSVMTEIEERDTIALAIKGVRDATGSTPRGWISQDYGESTRTPHLLAEAGVSYVADWANDDQPYWMGTEPPILSIPNQADWDDVQLIWHRNVHPKIWRESVCESFTRLHADGRRTGMFFGLHLHPWLIGAPHRIGYLESALAHIMSVANVWRATADQVADYMRGQLINVTR